MMGRDPIWRTYFFQMGWFNHQLTSFGCVLCFVAWDRKKIPQRFGAACATTGPCTTMARPLYESSTSTLSWIACWGLGMSETEIALELRFWNAPKTYTCFRGFLGCEYKACFFRWPKKNLYVLWFWGLMVVKGMEMDVESSRKNWTRIFNEAMFFSSLSDGYPPWNQQFARENEWLEY